MKVYLQDTVNEMIDSLKEQAKQHDVSEADIRTLFKDKRINDLDDLFNDGGEVRCEYFGDLAFEYALQFGTFESKGFEEARWKAIELAMKKF